MIPQETDLLARLSTQPPPARRVVVLAPHPDDEVFGCGGTLTLLRRAGATITVIILTDGAGGGEDPQGGLATLRAEESRQAAVRLELPEPRFWHHPDRRLAYGEPLIQQIREALDELAADLVFLPAPTEWHPDHQVTALAGAEALRRSPMARQAAFYELNAPIPDPNLLVDITPVVELKARAMACFPSQLREQPYDQRISGLNCYRAFMLGAAAQAAEAFILTPAAALAGGVAPLFGSPLSHRRRAGFPVTGADLPLVSVLIRSMDRPTLERALDSLALQTWSNLEVVVVNAKGGGHTPLPNRWGPCTVRMVNQGGEPLSRPRAANRGLMEGRGEYLTFLDDDDSLDPDHLHHLVTALRAAPTPGAAYAGVRCLRDGDPPGTVAAQFNEPGVTFARLLLSNVLPIHAVLFPAAPVREAGIRVDESLELYEDWDFWLQLARHLPFIHVDRVSATYHAGGDSAVAPVAADPATTHRALMKLYAKWLPLLTPEELQAAARLFHRDRDELHRVRTEAHQQLTALHQELVNLQGTLGEARQELTATRAVLSPVSAELATHREEATALRAHLAAVKTSTSWRLTAPVRWIGHLGRRLLGVHRPHPDGPPP